MEYDIIGGVVSTEALDGLKLFKKEVSEIVAIMQKGNLTSLASAKEIAQVDKLRASTEILVEKQKLLIEKQNTQIANQQKLAAAADLTAEKQRIAADKHKSSLEKIRLEEEKLQILRDNNNTKNALAQQKYIDGLKRRADAEATKSFSGTQGGVTQKTDLQAQATVMKLNATIASQYTSELQKMDAQMKLISLDLQKMVVAKQTESKAYTDGIAKLKATSIEYDRLSKASGASMMKTKSMYGSTFQLTQVMRELPNFAIDARIGFMALSNNLPMLADGFSQLKNEIDATTGKAYGFGGAAKIFAKSLLSLNTIMIVASTLLVLFGDDMIDFIGKLFKGADAIDNTSIATKALFKVLDEASGQSKKAAEDVIKLGAEINKFGGDADSAKIIIDEFNKTFNTHLTTIQEVKAEYPKMAAAFIQNAIAMQAAMDLIGQSADQMLKSQKARLEIKGFNKEDVDKVMETSKVMVEAAKNLGFTEEEMSKNILKGNGFASIADRITESMGNAAKAGFEVNPFAEEFVATYGQYMKIQGANKIAQSLTELGTSKKIQNALQKSIEELLPAPIDTTKPKGEKDTKDKNKKVPYIFPVSMVGDIKRLSKELKDIKFPDLADPFNAQMAAIDKVLTYSIDQYTKGNFTFAELEKIKTDLYKEAEDANVVITEENQQKILEIERTAFKKREDAILDLKDIQAEAALETVDNLMAIWQVYFDYMATLVDKQLEKDTQINDEKVQQYKDETESGMHSKQELSDFEDRMKAYQKSQDEQAAEDKAELERNAFLVGKAFAIADIWLKFSQTEAAIALAAAVIAATPIVGLVAAPAYAATASALNLAGAISGTALAAAQSIPYFAQGGIMDKDGKAILGDGGKRELAISPSGNFFISKDTPTMYNLEKGTQILPDVNKVDLMSILALKQVMPKQGNDKGTMEILRSIDKGIKSQRQGNFYGMPLIKQLDNRSRYSGRNKSLMN